jgi:hypothetical protein
MESAFPRRHSLIVLRGARLEMREMRDEAGLSVRA